MKYFALTQSHTQNNVKEHSPIYNLAAYQQRQRQFKRQKLLKNFFDTAIFSALPASLSLCCFGELKPWLKILCTSRAPFVRLRFSHKLCIISLNLINWEYDHECTYST